MTRTQAVSIAKKVMASFGLKGLIPMLSSQVLIVHHGEGSSRPSPPWLNIQDGDRDIDWGPLCANTTTYSLFIVDFETRGIYYDPTGECYYGRGISWADAFLNFINSLL